MTLFNKWLAKVTDYIRLTSTGANLKEMQMLASVSGPAVKDPYFAAVQAALEG